jgi:thiamine-phosphate pyrophosphorylase
MEQAIEAESLDAAYLGVSPVFPTPTKADTAPAWGLAALGRLRAKSRHVLVGIGGITAENAAEVIQAGADGVAVVSAICGARDPESAARKLRRVVEAAMAG